MADSNAGCSAARRHKSPVHIGGEPGHGGRVCGGLGVFGLAHEHHAAAHIKAQDIGPAVVGEGSGKDRGASCKHSHSIEKFSAVLVGSAWITARRRH